MKKVIYFILIIASTFALTILPCFANVGGYGGTSAELLVPRYIIFTTHDDVVIANLTEYETMDNCRLIIGDGEYTILIDSEPNSTTITAENFYFEKVYLSYGPMYNVIATGPVIAQNLRYMFNVNSQDVVQVDFDYMYHYYNTIGEYNEFNVTDYDVTTPGQYIFDYNIRDLFIDADDTHFLYYMIDYFDISFTFETGGQNTFSFSSRSSSDYGLGNGFNYPETIDVNITQNVVNPNVLEWLTTSIDGFMKTEIFGDLTIGGIIAFVLAIPMVTWFLKLVAGG